MSTYFGEFQGDISAASKFIKHLISDTDLTSNDVIWVISEQQGNFKQYSFIPEGVTVVAVGSFDSLMLYKPLKDIFGNMDIHIAYPTFHYFSDDMIKFLNEDINEEFAAKTILVTEYDYQDSLDKYKNFNILKTGFGKDALGVFFESDHVDYQSKKY